MGVGNRVFSALLEAVVAASAKSVRIHAVEIDHASWAGLRDSLGKFSDMEMVLYTPRGELLVKPRVEK